MNCQLYVFDCTLPRRAVMARRGFSEENMSDTHVSVPAADEAAMERMRERLYAFCFPNIPRTLEEQQAFEQAAQMQYEHEESARLNGEALPAGAAGFRIGEFSISFEKGTADDRLTMKTVCPGAYGLLLRHGLLYRGAEGRR